MLVQNIYLNCSECAHSPRIFSASPGYVITVKGSCPRCSADFNVKLALVTPFSVDLVRLQDPEAESPIFSDQIRRRLVKRMMDEEVKKLSRLLPEDGERVTVHQAAISTLLWLVKAQGHGMFRSHKMVDVHFIDASTPHERAAVLHQIVSNWTPVEDAPAAVS